MITMDIRKRHIVRTLRAAVLLLFVSAFLSRCASMMTPTGGPRDSLPPVIVNMTPDNFSTNRPLVNHEKIYIEFDEFVQLKDQQKEFFTSPQMKKKPLVSLRGRGVVIQLRDTLEANTTYSLNFGSAIRDNNEGNPLYSMRYVFSTGPEIDSMVMSGYTADSYKADSVSKSFIWFFPADSVENVAEYDAYLDALDKPVEARIADYHVGGTGDHATVMPAGMPAFTKDTVYDGMMRNFAQTFGDAIVDRPTGATDEVAFGTTQRWAGIPFRFDRGAATDFPAASILIGGKVCYTHWAPAKAHANSLQISSPAAVDAEIAEARRALASGAELFIGGHGGAAGADAVRFKIDYLECVKRLLAANGTADEFAHALRAAYPELPGEAGLDALAQALYADR